MFKQLCDFFQCKINLHRLTARLQSVLQSHLKEIQHENGQIVLSQLGVLQQNPKIVQQFYNLKIFAKSKNDFLFVQICQTDKNRKIAFSKKNKIFINLQIRRVNKA